MRRGNDSSRRLGRQAPTVSRWVRDLLLELFAIVERAFHGWDKRHRVRTIASCSATTVRRTRVSGVINVPIDPLLSLNEHPAKQRSRSKSALCLLATASHALPQNIERSEHACLTSAAPRRRTPPAAPVRSQDLHESEVREFELERRMKSDCTLYRDHCSKADRIPVAPDPTKQCRSDPFR